jgi:hypothetical protein
MDSSWRKSDARRARTWEVADGGVRHGANPSRLSWTASDKFPSLITTMYGDVGNKLVYRAYAHSHFS